LHAPSSSRRILSPEALVAVAFWGVSFVATRIALRAFHPFGLIATRLVLGTALLALVQLVRRKPLLPERGDRPACAALGVVLAVHLLLQAFGLRLTTAIRTGWIIAFIPIMIAVGARVVLGKRLAPLGWLGVAIGAAGVLVVGAVAPRDFAHARFGDLLQFVSCVTWTVYSLTAHRPAVRSGALRTSAFAMGVAAVLAAAAAASAGVLVAPVDAGALVSVLFLGLGCSGTAFFLWIRALTRDGPARSAAMLYFQPFVTLLAAQIVLGEPVTTNALAGGPIVLFGVWLVGRGTPRNTEP
jgi:drug/metabolite transporter (DMT)-like permease